MYENVYVFNGLVYCCEFPCSMCKSNMRLVTTFGLALILSDGGGSRTALEFDAFARQRFDYANVDTDEIRNYNRNYMVRWLNFERI